VPCRARTKRPCHATFNHRSARQLIYPTSSFVEQKGQSNVISTRAPSSDFEKICESQIGAKKPKLVYGVTKKKKKIVSRSLAPANCGDQKALIHVRNFSLNTILLLVELFVHFCTPIPTRSLK